MEYYVWFSGRQATSWSARLNAQPKRIDLGDFYGLGLRWPGGFGAADRWL
ncbi:MAG: hypothetical protein ABSG53_15475 [Thermoguttaceae bacterium]